MEERSKPAEIEGKKRRTSTSEEKLDLYNYKEGKSLMEKELIWRKGV